MVTHPNEPATALWELWDAPSEGASTSPAPEDAMDDAAVLAAPKPSELPKFELPEAPSAPQPMDSRNHIMLGTVSAWFYREAMPFLLMMTRGV